MNANEALQSQYISTRDVEDESVILTIQNARFEEVGQDKERKLVVSFSDSEQKLIVNKTNCRVIIDAYGKETNDWQGRRLEIFATDVQFGGKLTQGIRVRALDKSMLPSGPHSATVASRALQSPAPSAGTVPPAPSLVVADQITPTQIEQLIALAMVLWGANGLAELQIWLGCHFAVLTQAQAAAKIIELQQLQAQSTPLAGDTGVEPDVFAEEGEAGYVPDDQRSQVLRDAEAQVQLLEVPAPPNTYLTR